MFTALENQKPNFVTVLKVIIERLESNLKASQKLSLAHYCLDGYCGIHDWDFVNSEQCEIHEQSIILFLYNFHLLSLHLSIC